jgi:8-oxo-dGTP diphosphatase
MTLSSYKSTLSAPLKSRTLTFLLKPDQVLLGFKKTGFGAGYYLGIGGKVELDESIHEAAVREIEEEIGVTPLRLDRSGTLDFYFPWADNPDRWNQHVEVFLCQQWLGQIEESGEIRPEWFALDALPQEKMWDDARLWLPLALGGQSFRAEFLYDQDLKVQEHAVLTVDN